MYHYQQTLELLFDPKASKDDLIDALADIAAEYGGICNQARHGFRQNAEPELDRFRTIIEALKFKIKNYA